MLIAQLTDTHIRVPGSLAYGVVDTAAFLERAVAHLRALRPRPDVVLVTGDLTDFDLPEEYARFRFLIQALPIPIFAIPGNHDSSRGLAAAFPELSRLLAGDKVNYVVDGFDVRLVMLDSSVAGQPHGELGAQTLAWLDQVLGQDARPSLVALHHPPFLTGIAHMDVQNLRDAAALEQVLSRHSCVLGVVCGHVHRSVMTQFAGVPASIGPSPAHAVSLNLEPEAPPSFHMEPPSLHLHRIADGRLVTHCSYIGPYDGPYPFFSRDNRLLGAPD